jgi:triosephosphate isomerase
MRKKLLAGNWKMNLSANEARALIAALRKDLDPDAAALAKDREVMVAPVSIAIPAAAQALAGSSIALGAQNLHFEDKGAFTGEVSAPMLRQFGVSYVIVGHSERRHIFGEGDALINKKVGAAIRHRLIPILCVGETLDEHSAGKTLEVVIRQTQAGFAGVNKEAAAGVAVAYEPVWAIGTGKTATPEHAQMVQASIREVLGDLWDRATADQVRILYGGSVTPENVDSLLAKPDIDGALVGGASLKADSFARIVRARVA